jgi:hypothetical protein
MTAQLYPAVFGAAAYDAAPSVAAYSAFIEKFGTAEALSGADEYPWMLVAYAAYRYHDYAFATELLQYAFTEHMSENAYPWYSMEGAMAYLTASKMAETA